MSGERCPTCGQIIPSKTPAVRLIDSEAELLAILDMRTDRDVFRANHGRTWHYTYSGADRHEIHPDIINSLIKRRVLRQTYSNCNDSFGLGPTIDVERTLAARKQTGDKSILLHVGELP